MLFAVKAEWPECDIVHVYVVSANDAEGAETRIRDIYRGPPNKVTSEEVLGFPEPVLVYSREG